MTPGEFLAAHDAAPDGGSKYRKAQQRLATAWPAWGGLYGSRKAAALAALREGATFEAALAAADAAVPVDAGIVDSGRPSCLPAPNNDWVGAWARAHEARGAAQRAEEDAVRNAPARLGGHRD